MTTITWDLKTLSADTLVSDSAAMEKTGLTDERGWSLKSKLWLPGKHLTFENSPIVAVGASGNVLVGNLIVDYLLDRNLPKGTTRPTTLLMADLDTHATGVLAKLEQDASLLILTESHCWRLKAEPGTPVDIIDVTALPTAIGRGASIAQRCLKADLGGIKSIIEAARDPASETNFTIDYVARSASPTIKRAWQSYTTLRDPLRVNRVITQGIAVFGSLLTAAGGIALQAGGFTGWTQMLLVGLSMFGLVATLSSILTSLSDFTRAKYHLAPIVAISLLMLWDECESFLEAHRLTPLLLLYMATVFALMFLRGKWLWVSSPQNAVHLGACLTLGIQVAALTLYAQAPFDWPLFVAGTVGAGLGYAATLLTVNFMIRNYSRHWIIIERMYAR